MKPWVPFPSSTQIRCVPVSLVLRRYRQGYLKFKSILGYTGRVRQVWDTWDYVSRQNKQTTKKPNTFSWLKWPFSLDVSLLIYHHSFCLLGCSNSSIYFRTVRTLYSVYRWAHIGLLMNSKQLPKASYFLWKRKKIQDLSCEAKANKQKPQHCRLH